MDLWILNHYADPPDRQATRSYDLGKQLVKKGHHVSVFASSFSHYSLKDEELQKDEKWKAKDYDGVRFIFIKTFPYQKNDWRRVINVLNYSWRAFWIGKKLKEKPDVIIGTCVHPFAVLSAYLLSRVKKCHFYFEITDLWPQTLIDMGALSDKNPITWGLRVLEKFLAQKAKKIITLLPYVSEYLSQYGISKNKVVWIPNGVDLSRYKNLKPYNGGTSETFAIMYIGGYSKYHCLEIVLEADKILQNEGKYKVKFIFIGNGSEKKNIIRYSKKLGLQNIEFRGLIPKEKIADAMGEADAFVYSFKDLSLLKYGMSPVKLFDYLSSQRPILYAVKGGNNPVAEAKAGITIPPENPKALAQAIKKLITMTPEQRIQMGKNGLNYVKKYHDMRILASKLLKNISQ
ncbi:glycosyltransferase family 4 protein [Patescibacteria group bacterium AH-259-L05]|nr:glycosyltransferase family 4 protein [Patescibacteria group bacterium AH-259-L05]